MRYELVYSEQAQADLKKSVPIGLLNAVEAQLLWLARHPATLSRPSALPYPPGFQVYPFELLDLDGRRHGYTVFFRYGADEQSLHVAMIGHIEYAD